MAVDFDWSGKDWEISYSVTRLADGTKRETDHDFQVLETTRAKIKHGSSL